MRLGYLIALVVVVQMAGWLRLAAQSYGLNSRPPIAAFLNGRVPPSAPTAAGEWVPVVAFPNLTFLDPVFLTTAPRDNRLFVASQKGVIYAFENSRNTTNKTVFLDIKVRTQGIGDCGLLGFAFHPEFCLAGSTNRGHFYVYYQYSPNPSTNQVPPTTPSFNRLSRFTLLDGATVVDPNSELVLIQQYDEDQWHNGGGIFFGEDGFLYFSNGDEGGAYDEYNNAQTISKGLFGGVFRIDVNNDTSKSHPIRRQPSSGGKGLPPSFSANYSIPNDNPFLAANGSRLEEFFALGLRSPHRMTFDPVTKRIWVGDIGQFNREEIDLIVKGGNYQWAYREGFAGGPKSMPGSLIGTDQPPLYDYNRGSGDTCVIGGYVYRGTEHPDLFEKYVFGDNTSGRIWAMTYNGTGVPSVEFLCNLPTGGGSYTSLSSFGTDQNNELYLLRLGPTGQIYKLSRSNLQNPAPLLLSQTGAFTNLTTLSATNGLLPYTVNSPLWSDGSAKYRWMALPNNGAPYTTNEMVDYAPTGSWGFPSGTVFVKHFELVTNELNPAAVKRLETRFLVRATNGGVYGLTYKWRSDGSDAELLASSFVENITIQTASGPRTQTWYYPSRQDCLTCHNANANHVLGVNTRQLNCDFAYPQTARTDNQLRTWNHVGLFNPALNEEEIQDLDNLVAVTNNQAALSFRVRSYLDANCALCHRPGGPATFFDARFDTAILDQNIVEGEVRNDLGIPNARVIKPGNTNLSMMLQRLYATDTTKMPPLARHRVDYAAAKVFEDWILSLTNRPLLSVTKANLGQLTVMGEPGMKYSLERSAIFTNWAFLSEVHDGAIVPINLQSNSAGFFRLKF